MQAKTAEQQRPDATPLDAVGIKLTGSVRSAAELCERLHGVLGKLRGHPPQVAATNNGDTIGHDGMLPALHSTIAELHEYQGRAHDMLTELERLI